MDQALDTGRRIVQRFWDPDPTNDIVRDQPVWCLGCKYRLNNDNHNGNSPKYVLSPLTAGESESSSDAKRTELATTSRQKSKDETLAINRTTAAAATATAATATATAAAEAAPATAPGSSSSKIASQSSMQLPATPPDSLSSSLDSSLAYDEAPLDGGWPPAFVDDFESRIWMTYRCDFPLIARSSDPKAALHQSLTQRIKSQLSPEAAHGFSSDSGWGCMIRSGQSMLANAMLLHRLGRGWRRKNSAGHEAEEKLILSLFADDPRAPYSIHNFVRHGDAACGTYPGSWFGPSAAARCIQALTNANEPRLRVYISNGTDVYEDNFMKIAKPDGKVFHPTIILVSTRLGIDKITPVYWEALIASLQMTQSIGIAGGRPSSSHYFVGAQGQHFFYLDPHTTRPFLPYRENPDAYTPEEVESCHTRKLRCLHVRGLDPSMLIGFLIRDEEDWLAWRRGVKHVQGKAVIHVSDLDPMALCASSGVIDRVEAISEEEEDDEDEAALVDGC